MFVVRCYECEPPQEFILHEIFPHWENEHNLRFELYEATLAEVELVEKLETPLEIELDRLDAAVAGERAIMRPYYRWRLKRMRRNLEKLRDDQLRRIMETPFP